MSWHFSRALAEEFLAVNCLDGEQFAPLNATPTPETFCWPDKTTEAFTPSQFGMTCEHLTGSLGVGLLTWYRGDFPARILVRPEKGLDSKESAVASGLRCRGSFAKYDQSTCSWRTHQFSLLGGLDEFSETWPRWGSMRNGECWERITPQLPTSEKESGYWPTIRASDGERGGRGDLIQAVRGNSNSHFKARPQAADLAQQNGPLNPMWVEWLMGWPMGWTELEPLATARFHEWSRQHSVSCPAVNDEMALEAARRKLSRAKGLTDTLLMVEAFQDYEGQEIAGDFA